MLGLSPNTTSYKRVSTVENLTWRCCCCSCFLFLMLSLSWQHDDEVDDDFNDM